VFLHTVLIRHTTFGTLVGRNTFYYDDKTNLLIQAYLAMMKYLSRCLTDEKKSFSHWVEQEHSHIISIKFCHFYRATAMLSAVYAVVVCLSVSVCVSGTLRYCIKTAKRRITQTTPHDSPMTLVFWCQRSWRNSNGITPYGGDKCRWGGLKLVTFDEKHAITRKQYKIDV